MDEAPDVIRQQIEATRSSLTQKLETLEDQVLDTVQTAKNQVLDTVQTAKSTVTDTIETVRTKVQDTVETVKRTFDINHQVEQHPWPMVGGAIVAGYLAGRVLERDFFSRHPALPPASVGGVLQSPGLGTDTSTTNGRSLAQPTVARAATSDGRGLLSRFIHQFDSEIEEVKGLAIGAAAGFVRDLLKQSLPQLSEHIDEVMDSATRKLGGQPVKESLLNPS
jgi:ElaB/YqjD/DUF883 family membrane-anchored ribosome-binding protein